MPRVPASGTRRSREKSAEAAPQRTISDETRHGILAVVLLVVAGLSLLSLFGLAGPLGEQLSDGQRAVFGWFRFFVPIMFLVSGVLLLQGKRQVFQGSVYAGIILFVAGMTGIGRLVTETGGGALGRGVATPLLHTVGAIASALLLVAILLIGLLLMFNTSLAALAEGGSSIGSFARWLRDMLVRLRISREPQEDVPAEGPPPADFARRTIETPAAEEEEEPSSLAKFGLKQPKRKGKAVPIALPIELLHNDGGKPTSGDVKATSAKIQKTLANFGISVEMGEVNVGPTVTQYTLQPADGVKLSQIVTLSNDLALALAAHPIRIEAPIPGKPYVGVEVPNQSVAMVTLRELLESDAYRHRRSNLSLALGKDVSGEPIIANLASMPHLLIAGATGSGKSVAMKSIIVSLLYQNQPADLKFIMVDPKRVELTMFNDIPHLITPVITEVQKTINALRWTVAEMDRRYHLLAEAKVANIAGFNKLSNVEPLPYLVVVIDELADLMATAANDVEGAIVRLAQMARAVGIHLIVATQRPSVDVITGLIKANITTRVAFSVASLIDSRTILDSSGAEKLLGNGDMLYVSGDLKKPRRLQGALITEEEIKRVVEHLRTDSEPEYEETVVEKQAAASGNGADGGSAEDDMYDEAKAVVIQAKKASASLLQRRLRIGYARAARLLDIMEEHGVIGPLDGARPREVLVGNGSGAGDDLPPDDAFDDAPPPPEEEEETYR